MLEKEICRGRTPKKSLGGGTEKGHISRSLASTEDSASSYFRFGKKTCKNSDKLGGGDDPGLIAFHSASKISYGEVKLVA